MWKRINQKSYNDLVNDQNGGKIKLLFEAFNLMGKPANSSLLYNYYNR